MKQARMEPCVYLDPGAAAYPAGVADLLGDALPRLTAFGNVAILANPLLALLSSLRTPPELVLRSFDLARRLRGAGVPVVGGFHTPLEKDCLNLLLRGAQPVVVCPARGIEGMRLPRGWRQSVSDDRLLVLSIWPGRRRRPTVRTAETRNRLVAALARGLFIVHARPGNRVFRIAVAALHSGRQVYCFEHPRNQDLVLFGAEPLSVSELVAKFGSAAP